MFAVSDEKVSCSPLTLSDHLVNTVCRKYICHCWTNDLRDALWTDALSYSHFMRCQNNFLIQFTPVQHESKAPPGLITITWSGRLPFHLPSLLFAKHQHMCRVCSEHVRVRVQLRALCTHGAAAACAYSRVYLRNKHSDHLSSVEALQFIQLWRPGV